MKTIVKIFSLNIAAIVVLALPIAAFGFLVYQTTLWIETSAAAPNNLKKKLFKRFLAALGVNLILFTVFALITNISTVIEGILLFVRIGIIPLAVFLYLVVSMAKLATEVPVDKKAWKKLMICIVIDSLFFLPIICFMFVKAF